ncbi:MAG: gamma-glutamyl-gamma-aminobutyrate hydrolase family protein [Victivallaceae bacterium]
MKPLIGIFPAHDASKPELWIRRAYFASLQAAGVTAVILPDEADLSSAKRFDGFVVTGGGDVDPALYGEENCGSKGLQIERDRRMIAWIRRIAELDRPFLAICHGIQVFNVAFGGTLIQDVPSQYPGALTHWQSEPNPVGTHPVRLEADSLLDQCCGKREILVNSFHHQAVGRIGEGLTVEGRSADGIIEGLRLDGARWMLGVQFHPELMAATDSDAAAIFHKFGEMCL